MSSKTRREFDPKVTESIVASEVSHLPPFLRSHVYPTAWDAAVDAHLRFDSSKGGDYTYFLRWLVRRRVASFLRAVGKRPTTMRLNERIVAAVKPDGDVDDRHSSVRSAMASLRSRHRECLRLLIVQGYTVPEVAKIMRTSIGITLATRDGAMACLREALRVRESS